MKEMGRRDFLKEVVIGGAVLSVGSATLFTPLQALAGGEHDIGQCKRVRNKCISETGWLDNKKLIGQ